MPGGELSPGRWGGATKVKYGRPPARNGSCDKFHPRQPSVRPRPRGSTTRSPVVAALILRRPRPDTPGSNSQGT